LKLKEAACVSQVRVTLDPNLSEERCISVSKAFLEKEPIGVARELVRDFTVQLRYQGNCVWSEKISGNYQRLRVIDVSRRTLADEVCICVTATNGCPEARIFEVRIYSAND